MIGHHHDFSWERQRFPTNAVRNYLNTYSIYCLDIKLKGFRVIEMDGYITGETIREACKVLDNSQYCQEMVDFNYQLATEHYS